MELDTIDTIFLVGYAIFVIPMFISLFYEYDETLETIGDWMVMLTHLLILPAILLDFERKWYVYVLIYSLVTSVFYHLAKLEYIGQLMMFSNWDIAVQNVLMLSTFALLIFDPVPIPDWVSLCIAGSGIFIASLGEYEIGYLHIYQLVGGIVMIFLIIYLIYRFVKPTPLRNNMYIAISSFLAIIASITFIVGGYIQKEKYSMCHSIWHISAYIMLFFALKSINTTYTAVPKLRSSRFSNVDS